MILAAEEAAAGASIAFRGLDATPADPINPGPTEGTTSTEEEQQP
jgi:hypothetical protein